MNIVLRILINLCLLGGAFFAFVGALGVVRFHDTYCRMQASTCIATLGLLGAAAGGLLYAIFVEGSAAMAVKIVVLLLFVLFTNPISGHALCKGAYKHNIRPRRKMVIDDYGEDMPDE